MKNYSETVNVAVYLQIYPYLVVNDACLTESRREERVLQLLRMLNHFLGKQKVQCHANQINYWHLLEIEKQYLCWCKIVDSTTV